MKGNIYMTTDGRFMKFFVKDNKTTYETVSFLHDASVLTSAAENIFKDELARCTLIKLPAESLTVVTLRTKKQLAADKPA